MNRTAGHLADGREIFFYDDVPRQRTINDLREITRPHHTAQLRYDPLLDEWVAVAAARQHRTHLPSSDQCPLCPSTAERSTEVPQEDYDVVVFENRFPSFSGGSALVPGYGSQVLADTATEPAAAAQPLTEIRHSGSGRCEVVCFTPDHTTSSAQLSPTRMRTVIAAWADRTTALFQTGQVDQVYCFENRGEEIGVTLHHPHGQIYGYPFTTPRTRRMLDSARNYRRSTGQDLFAETLAAEHRAAGSADGGRIIAVTENWTAFVPAWARWPVEIHVYPHREVRTLPGLTEAERADLADLYLDILARGDRLFGSPLPYISGWHQAPLSAAGTDFRLHLQLFSIRRAENKLKFLAGSESGMGAFINDIPPEEMAVRLREAARPDAAAGTA